MLRRSTIVCLASIDWAFNWQVPQEVMSGLAAAGHRVLYIENTGVRRPAWKDAARVRARLRNWWRARAGVRPVAASLDVFSPLLLPFPYSRIAAVINTAAMLRVIRRWLRAGGVESPIAITFLPTPLARRVIAGLNPSLVVYYCADRFEESSPGARPIRDHERRLLAEADLVLATSSGLLAAASRITPRAALLSSGVRVREFECARNAADGLPEALRALPRPIIGYVGSLREQVDRALLAQVARLAPDLTFALVGPVQADVHDLAACPNVRLIGPVPHVEVARYMVGFDAGIIPYVLNAFTADVLPVKLSEYLAAGLPVISTALPEVHNFVTEHGPVVSMADSAETFVSALRAALSADGPAAVARRLEIARGYDTGGRIARLSDLMQAALDGRRSTSQPGPAA